MIEIRKFMTMAFDYESAIVNSIFQCQTAIFNSTNIYVVRVDLYD